MAGHPLLNLARTKSEALVINGKIFNIILSYNHVLGIPGFVVGLKFADETGSMDSAKAKGVNGIALANAIAHRAVQMLKPDLANIAILGFYLLTDDLAASRPGRQATKILLYDHQASVIHQQLKNKLRHHANFEVQGGVAWTMSDRPYTDFEQFTLLENELAKQIRVITC
jgi:hypothetical protein